MNAPTTVNLDFNQAIDMAAQILQRVFFGRARDAAKQDFKTIKQGKTIELGSLSIKDTYNFPLSLALDYSEFRGPGFNFDLFELALKSVLNQIRQRINAQGSLNIMSSEDNSSALVHLPGMVQRDQQLNVMVLALELRKANAITIKLMFVDPDQYQSVKK